jgi:hypothetical protein
MKFTFGLFLVLTSEFVFGQTDMVVTNSFDTLVCKRVELERHVADGTDFLVIQKRDGQTSRIALTMVFNYSNNGVWQLDNQNQLPVDEQTGQIIYRKIQNVEGVGSDELFARAKYWVANNYVSANDVIQLDDPKNGILVVKGNIPTEEFDGRVNHTLEIGCKNGKYKVEYKNLTLRWFVNSNPSITVTARWEEYAIEDCYPAMDKVEGFKAHKKFVIRATNKMDQSIKASLKSLDEAMRKPIQTDW